MFTRNEQREVIHVLKGTLYDSFPRLDMPFARAWDRSRSPPNTKAKKPKEITRK
jgi:hypothetical protein